MVEGPAAAEHREGPGGDAAEDHLEAFGISRAVDGRGPEDDRVQAPPVVLEHDRLRLVLGALVVIRRTDRRVLTAGRVVDVAVDAAGAAVDELPDARRLRGLQHVPGAPDVHVFIVAIRDVQLAERGREVLDDLDALDALPHDVPVGHAADHDPRTPVAQLLGSESLLVIEGDDLMAEVEQAADESLAGEARASRDENLHGRIPPE